MDEKKQFLVSAIENGTVIDHITVGYALKIVRILNLAAYDHIVTIGLNLPSRDMGTKDLVKVEGRELTQEEVNSIAILAPHATINIVQHYDVVKKFRVQIPRQIQRVIICPNPKCITNSEVMDTLFSVHVKGENIVVQCNYCERMFAREEIKEYRT